MNRKQENSCKKNHRAAEFYKIGVDMILQRTPERRQLCHTKELRQPDRSEYPGSTQETAAHHGDCEAVRPLKSDNDSVNY
mmetsp:Transcript_62640/g.118543  ORF Transcript_62640/g.118543 Transcript_62640/m.118543 type:complete len:80 (-) Transcript_62640:151-390(-)